MKKIVVCICVIIASCFVVSFLSIKYQKLKSAYWIIYFMEEFKYEKTNNFRKDDRYSFVINDNGYYIINERESIIGNIICDLIELKNPKMKSKRVRIESWIREQENNSQPLSKTLINALGSKVELDIKVK